MRRRLEPKPFDTLTIDLLADPHAFADPLPAATTPDEWIYQGTITIDGDQGALAWRRGGYGMGNGSAIRVLGVWEGIEIACAVGKADPARQHVPTWPSPPTWGITWGGGTR